MSGTPAAVPADASGPGGPPPAAALADIAADVAELAAELIRPSVGHARAVRTKSSATDVVTRTDLEAETAIAAELERRAPGSSRLGEEHGDHLGTSDVGWIVDPVDGTVNFLYDLPVVSVSIAATVAGEVVAGAVVDVLRAETYTAWRGGGARRAGRPIAVNRPTGLAQGLLVTGFSYDPAVRREQGAVLSQVVGVARDVRAFGSAALHLCFVACGRVDGYWETDLKPWDVAAGGLIAEEAGARVWTPATTGGSLTLAASPPIAEELHRLVAPAG